MIFFDPTVFTALSIPLFFFIFYKIIKGWFNSVPSPGTGLWIIILTYLITLLTFSENVLSFVHFRYGNEHFIPIVILQILISLSMFFISTMEEYWISRAYNELICVSFDFAYHIDGKPLHSGSFFKRLFISLKTRHFSIRQIIGFYYNLFRNKNFPFVEFIIIWVVLFAAIYINIDMLFG